jgi:hypothetical protein
VLWIVSLGVHLGYDYLVEGKGSQSGLGSASPPHPGKTSRPERPTHQAADPSGRAIKR